jgi:predicted kinase
MKKSPFRTPELPAWKVDWLALTEEFDWIAAMRDCPQDPLFHAERSVWTHVGMVCEALAALDEFRALPNSEREILFAAALLHDVAKPLCTRHEDGRITSRGHSQRGAIKARRILWELGVDFAAREQVCALVQHHQQPFHLIYKPGAQRMAFFISQTARCDLLSLLAQADALGRECRDKTDLLTNIGLFRELCRENDCLHGPRQFPSAHSRFVYFRTPGRDPDYRAYEDTRSRVTVMSGLPGSGKDAWIGEHLPDCPRISLDEIRDESSARRTGNQGAVVQAARERARVFLRAGQEFVWNATNLSREIRTQVIDLLAAYSACVRIVYVETSSDLLFAQNRSRTGAVPEGAIERMMDRWEVPDLTEAQELELWVDGERRNTQ